MTTVRFLLVASTQLYDPRALILTVAQSMAKPVQQSAYEMRWGRPRARRKLLELGLKGQALDLLAQHDLRAWVKRYNGRGLLADIDADRLLVVAQRCYGASGDEIASIGWLLTDRWHPSAPIEPSPMEPSMCKPKQKPLNDLSRSLTPFDPNQTLIAVIDNASS
jgi:hypothetical protein